MNCYHRPVRPCSRFLRGLLCGLALLLFLAPVHAQTFRFSLRAEPDVLPANGISTSSILVQVPSGSGAGITAAPVVRFVTSSGAIESQALLAGGIARVLLRSSTTPGTAIVTAFVGNAREEVTVEFTNDDIGVARYLEINGSYVAYGAERAAVTASGRCVLNYGDTHIESDVRLDVDLYSEFVWAEGGAGKVLIRHGKGKDAHELRGDRLFYDLRRRRGVMRRSNTTEGPARQEFMDSDFKPIPENFVADPVPAGRLAPPSLKRDSKEVVVRNKTVAGSIAAREAATSPQPSVTVPNAAPNAAAEVVPGGIVPGGIVQDASPEAAGPKAAGAEAAGYGALGAELPASDGQIEPQVELPAATPLFAPPPVETLPNDSAQADVTAATMSSSFLVPSVQSVQKQAPARRVLVPAPLLSDPSALAGPMSLSSDKGRGDAAAGTPSAVEAGNKPPLLAILPGGPQSSASQGAASTEDAKTPASLPTYRPLEPEAENGQKARLSEPPPPDVDSARGYWVAARGVRIYPHDKIQFEHATIFFNGGKLFSMPLYVVPLGQAFNPASDLVSFNTQGGVSLNIPYYYQASPRGTGAVYLQRLPGRGFATRRAGFSLAVEQQYSLSSRSQGRLLIDEIGRGGWNLNWQHRLQFSPTLNGSLYLDMPRHRDAYLRTSLLKDFSSMQVGFEGFYAKIRGGLGDAQGQFFARLRPKTIGKSGWVYNVSAEFTARSRYTELVRSGSFQDEDEDALEETQRQLQNRLLQTKARPLYGQTLNATLQAPNYRLWKGAVVRTSLLATAYNFSNGQRGLSPGLIVGLQQKLGRFGSMQLSYNYNKGGFGLLRGYTTNYLSGALNLNLSDKIVADAFLSKGLSDGSLYATGALDYYLSDKWRVGLFSDYSSFSDYAGYTSYGLTLGRAIGQRELTINWDNERARFYFEFGNLRY